MTYLRSLSRLRIAEQGLEDIIKRQYLLSAYKAGNCGEPSSPTTCRDIEEEGTM